MPGLRAPGPRRSALSAKQLRTRGNACSKRQALTTQNRLLTALRIKLNRTHVFGDEFLGIRVGLFLQW